MALTRGVDPDMIAAISANGFNPVLMCFIDWPDGAVYCHTGVGTIDWDGEDWLGVGNLGGVELPGEGNALVSASAVVSLAAPVSALMTLLSQAPRNRTVQILVACVTERAGHVLVADPAPLFTGYVDERGVPVSRDGETVTHRLELGLKAGPGARTKGSITHTAEDQAAKFPGDTAGRHVIYAVAKAQNPPLWPQP